MLAGKSGQLFILNSSPMNIHPHPPLKKKQTTVYVDL